MNPDKLKPNRPGPGMCDIGLRLPIALRDQLDVLTQQEKRSRNNLICWLLARAVEALPAWRRGKATTTTPTATSEPG